MKIIKLLFLWIVLLTFQMTFSQTAGSNEPDKAAKNTPTEEVKNSTDLDLIKSKLASSEKKNQDLQKEIDKKPTEINPGISLKLLILLPIFLFFLCLLITFLFAKRSKVDFKQAFLCEDPEEITKQSGSQSNLAETVKVTLLDNQGNPVYMPSVSRIIAFLSSLTTLAVIVCFVSYNAYCMVTKQPLPDFKNLYEIILGLGLGVVPYGFNKITTTAKP